MSSASRGPCLRPWYSTFSRVLSTSAAVAAAMGSLFVTSLPFRRVRHLVPPASGKPQAMI